MASQRGQSRSCTPGESAREYARGIAGGLVFSLPLLFTMEVWWLGFELQPLRLLAGIAGAFALLLGYNYFVGIRHDTSLWECLIDSVEEFGLGLLLSTLILAILGRITPEMALRENVGKIVLEALLVAIGVSVGTAQLGSGEDEDEDEHTGSEEHTGAEEHSGAESKSASHSFLGQIVIAACGAFLFAANVAPTDEIRVLAFEMEPWQVLALALLSFFIGILVLYFADFRAAARISPRRGLPSVFAGAALTYAVALLISGSVLWFFGRFDGAGSEAIVAQCVVLGLAASLGASAGRLLLQTN